MHRLLPFLFVLILAASGSLSADSRAADYGVWESFGANWKHSLVYPDFKLSLIEKKDGALYHFRLKGKSQEKELRWSAESKGPLQFELGGKSFVLEMLESALTDKPAKNYQVLIWQEPEFKKRFELRKKELQFKQS